MKNRKDGLVDRCYHNSLPGSDSWACKADRERRVFKEDLMLCRLIETRPLTCRRVLLGDWKSNCAEGKIKEGPGLSERGPAKHPARTQTEVSLKECERKWPPGAAATCVDASFSFCLSWFHFFYSLFPLDLYSSFSFSFSAALCLCLPLSLLLMHTHTHQTSPGHAGVKVVQATFPRCRSNVPAMTDAALHFHIPTHY